MDLSKEEKDRLVQELCIELHGKLDGGRKNIIAPTCPFCGHGGGKFGVYCGRETERKKPFMSHCFHCGKSTRDLKETLHALGREDLIPEDVFDFRKNIITEDDFSFMEDEDEIDDSLVKVEMPEYWKRTHSNKYLRKRGFEEEDYEYFPVGTTRLYNFKFTDYVIFPIIDNGEKVGYVSRHIWSKQELDEHNREAAHNGEYQIMRYRNSTENDFVKLLYNYDAVIEDETDTVIIVEGIFDVISLIRKLNLYENHRIAVVATFGKKISDIQIYKLQAKGVETVVVGYDGDSVETIKKVSAQLNEYFDVYIADIEDPTKDFDDMDFWEIFDVFSTGLKTPAEYKLNRIQL